MIAEDLLSSMRSINTRYAVAPLNVPAAGDKALVAMMSVLISLLTTAEKCSLAARTPSRGPRFAASTAGGVRKKQSRQRQTSSRRPSFETVLVMKTTENRGAGEALAVAHPMRFRCAESAGSGTSRSDADVRTP